MTAASDRFFITVKGKSCHASRPDKGVDAIAISAQIISALQNIASRTVSPFDNSVITIGKIVGGTRYNVGAEICEMEGTCRNYDPATRDMIERRMEEIVKGIAGGMGAGCAFRYVRGYSPIMNAPELVELVRETVVELYGETKANIPNKAIMGGEDFSFFAENVPGVYYRTGCHKPGEPVFSTHNEHLVVDPDCFPIGMQVMVECALKFLERDNL